MRPETAIIEIHGQYRIHTEFYGNPSAQQTIILVNGSLSTTASFAQTVKYLAAALQRGALRPAVCRPVQTP